MKVQLNSSCCTKRNKAQNVILKQTFSHLGFWGLRLKSSSFHMFLHRNISADDCAIELFKPLRLIYTEELPGVATHNSLFALLYPGVAVHERRITRRK